MLASSRLVPALAAMLLGMASVTQVACGVLHCVEDRAVEAGAPPCHGASDDDAGTASHAPGEGDDDCCFVAPLEPTSTWTNVAHAAPVFVQPRRPSTSRAADPVRLTARRVETGPPAAFGIASPVPLRI